MEPHPKGPLVARGEKQTYVILMVMVLKLWLIGVHALCFCLFLVLIAFPGLDPCLFVWLSVIDESLYLSACVLPLSKANNVDL